MGLALRFIRLGGLALLHGVPNMGVRPRELFLETSPLSILYMCFFQQSSKNRSRGNYKCMLTLIYCLFLFKC